MPRLSDGAKSRKVLFISADQWRWECLSALGHPVVKTPNLDALAAAPNANAIEPISDGRLNLYAAGYFTNPNLAYGTTASATDQVTLAPAVHEILTGTPPTFMPKRPATTLGGSRRAARASRSTK